MKDCTYGIETKQVFFVGRSASLYRRKKRCTELKFLNCLFEMSCSRYVILKKTI